MDSPRIVEGKAQRLLQTGWVPNMGHGSITRPADGKAGLVEDAVWQEMRRVLSLGAGFQPTQPAGL